MVVKVIDLTGLRYGRLVVIARAPNLSQKNTRWECLCDCGNTSFAQSGALRAGRNNSCGCLQKEVATRHGMEGSLIYMTWAQMKSRCNNERNKFYKDYGGRGIKVCDRWNSFEHFYADMGDKPKGLSLDRKNNDLGYFKENCKWSTQKEQILNRRVTVLIEYLGTTKPRIEWARQYGISPISLTSRLKLGWDIHKALTTPIDKRKSVKKSKPKP